MVRQKYIWKQFHNRRKTMMTRTTVFPFAFKGLETKTVRMTILKGIALVLAALFLFNSNALAACDGIKLNKKGNKVIIRNLYKCADGCGGGAHLFKEHVNKSPKHLKARLSKIKVASTYESENSARKSIAKALKANIGQVKDIINDKKDVIKFTASVPVKGTCVNRACPSEVTAINGTEKIFVYLKAKGSGQSRKVYIQTSYPKVDCACP